MLDVLSHIFRSCLKVLRLSAPVDLRIHEQPATIVGLDDQGNKRKTTLTQILEKCPSLYGKDAWYTPTLWLSSGHFATIFCTLNSFGYDTVTYSRELIRVPDGGQIGLDFCPPITPEHPLDDSPILVIAHGLTGGSHESYVRDVLSKAIKPKSEGGLGWRGMVVNSRGCAGVEVTSNVLYSGGVTNDLRCALTFLSHFAPNAPLYLTGFSLGANQSAKLLGEDGDATPIKGCCVLGAPWNFVDGHVFLSRSYLQLVYSRAMAKNLRRVLNQSANVFKEDKRLDWDAIYGNPYQTLYEFDSIVTAPLAGFPTGIAYYRWASADQHVSNVKVPLLSLSAADDPIVAAETVPQEAAAQNPNLIFAITKHGGHLGWFQGLFKPRRWISRPVLEFLSALHEADPSPRKGLYETEPAVQEGRKPQIGDKMVMLKGRPEVGFQLIKEEKHVAGPEEVEGLTRGL